jgi:hypothetical protein
MYFSTKNYLKSTHNYTAKRALNLIIPSRPWRVIYIIKILLFFFLEILKQFYFNIFLNY